MKQTHLTKGLRSLVIFLMLCALSTSMILIFGCVPGAETKGPAIDPARQKAIQDSLQQIYDRKLNIKYSTGYEYYKNKMYRNCIRPLWEVVEIDTARKFKNTFAYLSDAYIQLNNADSAQMALELGTKVFADNAYLHRNLGYLYGTRGRVQEAISEYEKAVALEDNQVSDWKQLANLYIRDNQPAKAIKAYEKVVTLDPQDQEAHTTLSQLYKSSGDAEAAIKRMEEVKKLDPKNTENLFNLGREYFDNTNYERAVENFTALLSLEPTDISAYSYLGASYQNSGKFNEALTAYKKATDIQPDNKKLLTDIATCYRELGSFATARTYANKALAIDANYGLAYIVRGEIYESAVESCMKSRGKESPEFDDKLVFELAYKEYQKATSDLQFKDLATTKLRYLQDFIPKKEDRFFHKHTEAKLSCYKWIY